MIYGMIYFARSKFELAVLIEKSNSQNNTLIFDPKIDYERHKNLFLRYNFYKFLGINDELLLLEHKKCR